MAVALTIASGANVSSAFAFTQHAGAIAIEVPSHAAGIGAVRLEFASTSGGPTFGPFLAPHAATAPLAVWSGQGPGWGAVLTPPTPWGRIALTGSAAAVMSFGLYPLNHR